MTNTDSKIAVIMAVHDRIELTCVAIDHLQRVTKQITGKAAPIYCAYTKESDGEGLRSAGIPRDCMVKVANDPVSEKHNDLLNLAMADKSWTHLLHMGSDNFILPSYLKQIIEAAKQGAELIGTPNLAVIRPNISKAVHFNYNKTTSGIMGAGRLFSRELLKRTLAYPHRCTRTYYNWRKNDICDFPIGIDGPFIQISDVPTRFVLWPFAANKGLDNMSMKLLKNWSKTTVIHCDPPAVLDVKLNDTNITSWGRLYDKRFEVNYDDEINRFKLSNVFYET